MIPTRREFMGQAAAVVAASEIGTVQEREVSFELFPIGKVEREEGGAIHIRIFEEYTDALLGLDGWSHVNVFYWFDRNDQPAKRRILRVHPRGDKKNPLTGVFACRAPVRPNLIALSTCKILAVKDALVRVDAIDAFDGTPVLDLKPLIPKDLAAKDLEVPGWARRSPKKRGSGKQSSSRDES